MTTDYPVGASSDATMNRPAVNWRQVHRNVRRLQVRIVKATQEGRWGKVKALQHLLTRSFSGRALAVRRVTENQGKRTPGVDGIVWDTAKKKIEAVLTLRQRRYQTRPLRRIYIPKNNGKGRRPLSIPCMRDRAMQALYLLALDPIAETTADPNSYGFRQGRSPADAVERIHHVLTRKNAAQWILKCDIKSCFDKISHPWLLDHIPMETTILKKWLKAGFIDRQTFLTTDEVVPHPHSGLIACVFGSGMQCGLVRESRLVRALSLVERERSEQSARFGTERSEVRILSPRLLVSINYGH
jgi:RNA-directed DNA polymerase